MMLFLVDDSDKIGSYDFLIWANTVDEAVKLWRVQVAKHSVDKYYGPDTAEPLVHLIPLRPPAVPKALDWGRAEKPGGCPLVREGSEIYLPPFELGVKAVQLGAVVTSGGKSRTLGEAYDAGDPAAVAELNVIMDSKTGFAR